MRSLKKLNIRTAQRQLDISPIDVIDIPVTKPESQKPPPRPPCIPIPSEIEELPSYVTIPLNDEWVKDIIPPPPTPPSKDNWTPPFTPHETPPTPIGGYEAISKNLVYPRAARLSGIEGQVLIAALIDEEGWVDSTRVIKSLGPMG